MTRDFDNGWPNTNITFLKSPRDSTQPHTVSAIWDKVRCSRERNRSSWRYRGLSRDLKTCLWSEREDDFIYQVIFSIPPYHHPIKHPIKSHILCSSPKQGRPTLTAYLSQARVELNQILKAGLQPDNGIVEGVSEIQAMSFRKKKSTALNNIIPKSRTDQNTFSPSNSTSR